MTTEAHEQADPEMVRIENEQKVIDAAARWYRARNAVTEAEQAPGMGGRGSTYMQRYSSTESLDALLLACQEAFDG